MSESSDSDACVPPAGARSADQLVPDRGSASTRGQYKKRGGEHLRDWRVAPPPSVVALVAQSHGKWSDVFCDDSALSNEFTRLLLVEAVPDVTALQGRVADLLLGDASACVVVGFALVQSWEFHDPAERSDVIEGSSLDLMMQHFRSDRHSRSQFGFRFERCVGYRFVARSSRLRFVRLGWLEGRLCR